MGQIIGTVNVQVGPSPQQRVNSISYGGPRTLKSASDLDSSNGIDRSVITYLASTNSFVLQPFSPSIIDNGFF